MLPLSPSTQAELLRFLASRADSHFDSRGTAALLSTSQRSAPKPYTAAAQRTYGLTTYRRYGSRPYSISGLQTAITRLFALSGVKDSLGRSPRVHDLRHSFAVQALARWYRQQADIQDQLPKLAMYMGHVSIESTAHYLRLTEEVAALASDRFHAHFASVIGGQP